MRAKDKNSFWIVNTSNRLISLGDIGICLQPYQSVNLLDSIRYPYLSIKHIKNSLTTGSLFKRSDKIKIRKIPPPKILKGPPIIHIEPNLNFPSKVRSIQEFKEEKYEELEMLNEKSISENIELAEIDDVGKFKKD